jgi:hypothetical protein
MVPNDGTNKTMDTPIVDAFLFFWYRIWTLAGGGTAAHAASCMRFSMVHARVHAPCTTHHAP